MEPVLEREVPDPEELTALYEHYGWWADRTVEDVERAITHSDEFVGIRDGEDGTLVASGRVLTDYVYIATIRDVIVAEPHRGTGVGRLLMETIVELPELANVEFLTLNCQEGLVPFYEEFGFAVHDMTVELPDGTETGYRMMVRRNA